MADSHNYCLAFSRILRQHWEELSPFVTTVHFERGQPIFSMGDAPVSLYLVQTGQVKLVQLGPQGQEKIIGIYQAGDWFGEVCLCETARRRDQAVALEAATIVSFSVPVLLKLMKDTPQLGLNLLIMVCSRLVECQEQAASLVFDGVRARLAKEILRLSGLPYCRQENGGVRLAVGLTHEELGQLVNTTRENATTIMNEFRRLGLVDYRRGAILVYPQRIRDYLNQNRLQ